MMAKATWNDVTLAESDRTEVVEGNHYFPPDSLNRQYFRESDVHFGRAMHIRSAVGRERPVITMSWSAKKSMNRRPGTTQTPNLMRKTSRDSWHSGRTYGGDD